MEIKITSIADTFAATRRECRLASAMADRVLARRRQGALQASWARAEAIAASNRTLDTCARIVALSEARHGR